MVSTTSRWKKMTPMLAFSCFSLMWGSVLFGFDTGSFGGILANPGFVRQFGELNAQGQYVIKPLRASLLSSLAFIGKFLGCLVAGPSIERLGHRKVFFGLCLISIVGVIIEISSAGTGPGSGRVAQFIVGRVVVYMSIGLVEVCVSTYQSEIVPAELRGFVVNSLQLFLNCGGLLATGVNKAFSTFYDSTGWKTVTGIQFLFPLLILVLQPFLADSPRWLLSRDRSDEALTSLRRLRTKDEVLDGRCEQELLQIQTSLQERIHKSPSWMATISPQHLRRTLLVVAYYTYQQITGQAFVSTYQTVFYKANGYAHMSFTYPIISSCLSVLACLPSMWLVDTLGRRPMLVTSFTGQALFLCLLAGLGAKEYKTTAMRNACVAFFMLFNVSYSLGGAPIPYLLGAELPSHAVREKTVTIGTTINVVWAFATNFSIPYMLAAINWKVGWVFGAISISAIVFTFLFLPETAGCKLEDIDDVFSRRFNPFRWQRSVITSKVRGESKEDREKV